MFFLLCSVGQFGRLHLRRWRKGQVRFDDFESGTLRHVQERVEKCGAAEKGHVGSGHMHVKRENLRVPSHVYTDLRPVQGRMAGGRIDATNAAHRMGGVFGQSENLPHRGLEWPSFELCRELRPRDGRVALDAAYARSSVQAHSDRAQQSHLRVFANRRRKFRN